MGKLRFMVSFEMGETHQPLRIFQRSVMCFFSIKTMNSTHGSTNTKSEQVLKTEKEDICLNLFSYTLYYKVDYQSKSEINIYKWETSKVSEIQIWQKMESSKQGDSQI